MHEWLKQEIEESKSAMTQPLDKVLVDRLNLMER